MRKLIEMIMHWPQYRWLIRHGWQLGDDGLYRYHDGNLPCSRETAIRMAREFGCR